MLAGLTPSEWDSHAVADNRPVIAALKRCATQNRVQVEFFRKPQGLGRPTTFTVAALRPDPQKKRLGRRR